MFVVVVVVVIVIIVCSLVGKVSDKRVNVLKLEHIPNDAPGVFRGRKEYDVMSSPL